MINGATLSKAMGGRLSLARYTALADDVNKAMRQAGCTTVNRAAMFLAQVCEESGGLEWMTELASGSEYEGRKDLGNTQPGDGPRFKGRGPIQVTGRNNYTALSRWAHDKGYVPSATYFVDNPTALADDKYAFLGAVWFWVTHNLNRYGDNNDVRGATLVINGGTRGLPARQANWNRIHPLGTVILPGKVLTKVNTFKVGDTVRVSAPKGAAARRAPGGPKVVQGGKQVGHPAGFQFKATALAKAKDGSLWVKGPVNWFAAKRLTPYRLV